MTSGSRMLVAAVAILCLGAKAWAAPVVLFQSDFDTGYTGGAMPTYTTTYMGEGDNGSEYTANVSGGTSIVGQPSGSGPQWTSGNGADGVPPYVITGAGPDGTNAGGWAWNCTHGNYAPWGADGKVSGLPDPGRSADLQFKMDLKFDSTESTDLMMELDVKDSGGNTVFQFWFGSYGHYYPVGGTSPQVALGAGAVTQTGQSPGGGTLSLNKGQYYTILATIKYDVDPAGPNKDTIELSVDGVQVVAPIAFNAAPIDSADWWLDGAPAAWGPIYMDNLYIGQPVPEPATLALLAAAGIGLLGAARRRMS